MATSESSDKRKRTVLGDESEEKEQQTMDHRESITNQTKVSLTMAKHLFSKESDNNIVFSPLSLQVMLSIIAAASEGPTQQQLLDFLRSNSTEHLNSFASHLISIILSDDAPFGGPRLSFVQGVWVDQSISLQPSFKQIMATDYNATLASVDFQNKATKVIKEVNLWAKKETNGLVKEILTPESVDNLTRLIFANAMYFKGTWTEKFHGSSTKNGDFYLLNGSSVKVPFMTSSTKRYIEGFDGFDVLRLPYNKGEDNRQFSMYIFLPNAKDGLSTLLEKLTSEFELLEHNLSLIQKVEVSDFRIQYFIWD